MAARLDTGADDGKRRDTFAGKEPRRHRRDRRRPRFGDEAAIEQRAERAGLVIQQKDGGQMRRETARRVAAENRDHFGAERF